MHPKKTAAELRAENRMLRNATTASTLASVINNLIKSGALCFIFWMGYSAIACLAGKSTDANIALKVLGNIKISKAVAILFGSGGIMYGIGERKLKQRTIKRLEGRIKESEKIIDTNRSSSRLTKTGDTHPRDKK